jgi:hypothetical protein
VIVAGASSAIFTVDVPVELRASVTPGIISEILLVALVIVPIPVIDKEALAAALSE